MSRKGSSYEETWILDIPLNAKIGENFYHSKIYYDEFISGEWDVYRYWESDIRYVSIRSIHEKTYNETHDEIVEKIDYFEDLNSTNSESKASFDLAKQEYGLSTFYKDKNLWKDAVDHLILAEYHVNEALDVEKNHWKTKSENIILRLELDLEGIGNITDPQLLDLNNQTLEKIIQAETFYGEDTIQGYREAFSIAQEAELLFYQLKASMKTEPEPKPEPEPEPSPEPEEKPQGIPGFPLESLFLGIVLCSILIWLIMRDRV